MATSVSGTRDRNETRAQTIVDCDVHNAVTDDALEARLPTR